MKISYIQDDLKRGLAAVNRAIPNRSPLPITKSVLLNATDAKLKLTATNLEFTIITWINAQVETEGGVAIPARLLTDLVSSLPSDTAVMEVGPASAVVNINCGSNKAKINGANPDEFPPIVDIEGGAATTIDSATLKRAINKVAFAAAVDNSRPVLTGVELRLHDDRFAMAAADGFRLAVYEGSLTGPVAEETRIIIPAKSLTELARLLEDDHPPVQLTLSANNRQILFRSNGEQPIETIFQLLEGSFPNYESLIPQSHQTKTIFDFPALQQAARTTAIFANKNSMIKLDIQPDENGQAPGTAIISASSEETGSTQNQMVPDSIDGQPVKIAFNSRYLLDTLSAIGSGKAILQTTAPNAPGVFRSHEDPDDTEKYVHVVMPMAIYD